MICPRHLEEDVGEDGVGLAVELDLADPGPDSHVFF
jgi:hypothetical protein